MNNSPKRQLLAMAALLLCASGAHADWSNKSNTRSLGGFGTLSLLPSDRPDIEFCSDHRMPAGMAYHRFTTSVRGSTSC
jgi:hypothetical protein